MNTAYFVRKPRNMDELIVPHLLWQERQYEIVAEKLLSETDYENFITDMQADRQYIEDCSEMCHTGSIMKCILLRKRGESEGVLAVSDPDRPDHVLWAGVKNGKR